MVEERLRKIDGKSLWYFDNCFNFEERERLYSYCLNQKYSLSGSDVQRLETKGDYNLYCNLSPTDVDNMGIEKLSNYSHIKHHLDDYTITQARINLSTIQDKNRFHCDTGAEHNLTMLYYPNMEWEKSWGGQTLFSNLTNDTLEWVSFYIPGRIILFDGSRPHSINPPTIHSPTHRFSIVIQYGK